MSRRSSPVRRHSASDVAPASEVAEAEPTAATSDTSDSAGQPATDEQLLARFLTGTARRRRLPDDDERASAWCVDRSEQAFAELVARHGPLVLAVCRRTLGIRHDAEDAFQATFLVLARKARSLRSAASLPAWLYQTAYRIALRARAARAKRREFPLENEAMIAPDTLRQIAHDYEQSLIDDELDRLPEKYRLPVFLCCLEGKSLDEAARQLGWSVGSVKGRLERGRMELRRRLSLRRGAPAVAVALALCLPKAASAAAAVSPALVASTVHAGVSYAAGNSALGFVSHQALSLAQGSNPVMSVAAVKIAACTVLSVGLLAWGGTQFTVAAGGSGSSGPRHVIELNTSVPAASLAAAAGDARSFFLTGAEVALAGDGDAPREGARERDGDRPREGAARDGERPREGAPRDGERPRSSAGLSREGAPREGAREGAPREGAREAGPREDARDGARGEAAGKDPLRGFRPANQREAALLQMIQQLRNEVAALRAQMQSRRMGSIDGGDGARDGERREGVREGARDGERPREGARDADGVRKPGPRDGEAPKAGPRDGEKPATRDGERPRGEGDGAPKKDGE